MSKRDGNQKGAQSHPQGGHGDKTHSKIVETLHQNTHATEEAAKSSGVAKQKGNKDRQ